MKYFTLLIAAVALFASNICKAQEEPAGLKDFKFDEITIYASHEFLNLCLRNHSIGVRGYKDKFIADLNVGGRIFPAKDFMMRFDGNLFYEVISKASRKVYLGIGNSMLYLKEKVFDEKESSYYYMPSIKLGHEFSFPDKGKIFTELSYYPYLYGKGDKVSIHSLSFKIGTGF